MKFADKYIKELETISDKEKIETFVRVAGGVIMKEGENGEKLILLIKRAEDDHYPNFWEFPRGKCDKGVNEKLIPCAKREIKEECGLDVKLIKFIDKFSYLADRGTRKSTQYNFLCKMKDPNQEVKLSKEHDDFKWVQSVGEVELLCLPEIKKTISKILNVEDSIVTYHQNNYVDNEEKIKEGEITMNFKKVDKMVDYFLNEIATGPGGHIPDGSGPPPHGRGQGPGRGTQNCKNSVSERNCCDNKPILENKYREFFKIELKRIGKSIPKMSDSEKKSFFNNIKKKWKATKKRK